MDCYWKAADLLQMSMSRVLLFIHMGTSVLAYRQTDVFQQPPVQGFKGAVQRF